MIARMWRGWVHTDRLEEYVEIVERTGMTEYRAPGQLRVPSCSPATSATDAPSSSRSAGGTTSTSSGRSPATTSRLAKYYAEDDGFLVDRETTVSHFEVAPGWTAPIA